VRAGACVRVRARRGMRARACAPERGRGEGGAHTVMKRWRKYSIFHVCYLNKTCLKDPSQKIYLDINHHFEEMAWQLVGLFSLMVKLSLRIE
jgi:hypothetical protein